MRIYIHTYIHPQEQQNLFIPNSLHPPLSHCTFPASISVGSIAKGNYNDNNNKLFAQQKFNGRTIRCTAATQLHTMHMYIDNINRRNNNNSLRNSVCCFCNNRTARHTSISKQWP
ncbi:unnamed protein product [Ceratitis capitata]|uniref:(Mediterranean fruit fly) hypothetical protein n=1 Tax=Ceratitis capitata TaxID=7213 RepID=A0A811UW87_CERCA|nr:unnamed protein product [Ceratitis capitata]